MECLKIINACKLKELRKQSGLSQFQLSLEVDVSRRTIESIETGETKMPKYSVLERLAEFFKVEIKELL